MAALVWFRNDLRVLDNPALWHACREHTQVHALFLITRKQWALHDMAPVREHFLQEQVEDLRTNLARMGIQLLVKDVADFKASPAGVINAALDSSVTDIYYNAEYELNEQRRDEALCAQASAAGFSVKSFHDQCLIAPGRLLNQQGSFFRVYTPFRRACLKQLENMDLSPLPAPKRRNANIEPAPATRWSAPAVEASVYWPAGEKEAHSRLKSFINKRIRNYKDQRDLPALDATSTLSPYLAVGAISLRQCLHAARSAGEGLLEPGQPGIFTWINELLWREFYRHIAYGFPEVCRHKAFQPDTDMIPWRGVSPLFEAWCEGQTGYPLVDAGMRQLLATGWMHNRVRMVTAMFLSKHLFTDWRLGEKFFMQNLVDGDFCANNGGWQWSASTGADAAPYFRVFNPTLQSQRFDAQGDYIREWVPELKHVKGPDIHSPSPLIARSAGYPLPVVEHKAATEYVKRQFSQLNAMRAQAAT